MILIMYQVDWAVVHVAAYYQLFNGGIKPTDLSRLYIKLEN